MNTSKNTQQSKNNYYGNDYVSTFTIDSKKICKRKEDMSEYDFWNNDQNTIIEDVNSITSAIKKNHIQELHKLLFSLPKEINKRDCHGDTPLNVACGEGNLEVVKILIKHKADINLKAHADFSPISTLCYVRDLTKNHIDVLSYLLNLSKINIESKSQYGSTPLLLSVESAKRNDFNTREGFDIKLRLKIIKKLLANNANINAKNDNGENVFCSSSVYTNAASNLIVNSLLEKYVMK